MKYLILMLAVGLVACGGSDRPKREKPKPQDSKYYFESAERVDNQDDRHSPSMYRMENSEIICYVEMNGDAMVCKWKEAAL